MPMPLERALSWGVPPSLGDLLQRKTKKPHRKHFICDLLQFLFQAVGKFPFPKMIFFSCSRKWGGDTVRGLFQLLWKGFICMLKCCMSWSSGCKELPKETEWEGSLYLQKPWGWRVRATSAPGHAACSIISLYFHYFHSKATPGLWGHPCQPGGCSVGIPGCSRRLLNSNMLSHMF